MRATKESTTGFDTEFKVGYIIGSVAPERCGCNPKSAIFISTHIKNRYSEHFQWCCLQGNATRPYWWLVKYGSGTGLVPSGNRSRFVYPDLCSPTAWYWTGGKPLTKPMVTHFTDTGHDDVIKWKHFPRYWPFVRGIHRWPVNSPHKGQWRRALMFSLIFVWINDSVNTREAGDLRHHRAYYDVTVMNISPGCFYLRMKICFSTFNYNLQQLPPHCRNSAFWHGLKNHEYLPLMSCKLSCKTTQKGHLCEKVLSKLNYWLIFHTRCCLVTWS